MKYLVVILLALSAYCTTTAMLQLFTMSYESVEIPIVISGTLAYAEAKAQLVGYYVAAVLFLVLFVILDVYLFAWYHQLRKKKRDTLNIGTVQPPCILYLRSFVDDLKTRKKIAHYIDFRSEEEILVEVLSDIAPVYAIGDPRDKRLPHGASRIYVDDEHWKETVVEVAQKSVAVVLRLGKTDSFWWEVEMALKNIPLQKLLFVVPESKTFGNVALLYKILLDHGIDIRHLDIQIGKKRSGSISSILYFDQDGVAQTAEVVIPRFTRFFISYEHILRNTLSGFRAKYGLSTKRMLKVRMARVLQVLVLTFILFIAGSSCFRDCVALKYQMPYELVEQCVQDSTFIEKYSHEINGTNLVWSLVEAKKGVYALEDEDFLSLLAIEAEVIQQVSRDELEQMNAEPQNLLLLIKKYLPDAYMSYVNLLAQAAVLSVHYPDEVGRLIQAYQESAEFLPDWVNVLFAETESMPSDEAVQRFYESLRGHWEDDGFADIMKIVLSQTIGIYFAGDS